jgi:hypothetical protein
MRDSEGHFLQAFYPMDADYTKELESIHFGESPVAIVNNQ